MVFNKCPCFSAKRVGAGNCRVLVCPWQGLSYADVIAVLACTLLVSFISAITDVTVGRCSEALVWRSVDSVKDLKHGLIVSGILVLLSFMWPAYGVVGCSIISGYFAGGFKSLASAVIWFLVYAAYAFVLRKSF